MFRTLADHDINLRMISTSPIKISCMIARDEIPTAVRALHDAFELETRADRWRPDVTRLAILGATGAVGATLLRVLEERAFPLDELRLLASRALGRPDARATRGDELDGAGRRARGSFDGIDIAIFSAGATRSREWAPQAVARGRRRRRQLVGLPHGRRACRSSCADVNPHAARGHAGLIANPNCSTMQLDARAEADPAPPLAARARHRRRPTSRSRAPGRRRSTACARESAAVLAGERAAAPASTRTRSRSTCCPFAGALSGDDGYTDEELKLVNESRKILELPDLRVSARPACACRS